MTQEQKEFEERFPSLDWENTVMDIEGTHRESSNGHPLIKVHQGLDCDYVGRAKINYLFTDHEIQEACVDKEKLREAIDEVKEKGRKKFTHAGEIVWVLGELEAELGL